MFIKVSLVIIILFVFGLAIDHVHRRYNDIKTINKCLGGFNGYWDLNSYNRKIWVSMNCPMEPLIDIIINASTAAVKAIRESLTEIELEPVQFGTVFDSTNFLSTHKNYISKSQLSNNKSNNNHNTHNINNHYNNNSFVGVLFMGDSHEESLIYLILPPKLNGKCEVFNDNSKTIACVSPNAIHMKRHVYSAFSYHNDNINYCIEFKNQTRYVFMNNTALIDHSFLTFHNTFHNYSPDIIGFSLNFWELVRIRELAYCNDNDARVIDTGKHELMNITNSRIRWEAKLLDTNFINEWIIQMTLHFKYVYKIAKKYNPTAIVFTRTFQRPLINIKNGRTVHTNLHSSNAIRQLNAAIRIAVRKSNVGIYLLDVERMTDYYYKPQLYLSDSVHPNADILLELYNILLNWHKQALEK